MPVDPAEDHQRLRQRRAMPAQRALDTCDVSRTVFSSSCANQRPIRKLSAPPPSTKRRARSRKPCTSPGICGVHHAQWVDLERRLLLLTHTKLPAQSAPDFPHDPVLGWTRVSGSAVVDRDRHEPGRDRRRRAAAARKVGGVKCDSLQFGRMRSAADEAREGAEVAPIICRTRVPSTLRGWCRPPSARAAIRRSATSVSMSPAASIRSAGRGSAGRAGDSMRPGSGWTVITNARSKPVIFEPGPAIRSGL
jgi:hypothetical protein